MALEELCAKQTSEIMQLNHLVSLCLFHNNNPWPFYNHLL
jgi:hypothetical protein